MKGQNFNFEKNERTK